MEKENDFLVAKLENPQSGVLDFMDTGLNTENTGMLTKDEYKKSPYIQQKFTQDGKFNESSFDKYYANANKEYQILAQNTYEDLLVKGVEFNSGDIYKPRGAKLKEVGYEITKITSPNKGMKGFGQLGKTEDPNWTASEIAQNEKIHDYKTGKEYEYSPNEAALTSSIPKFFSEIFNPKVIATWDNDGIHTDETTGEEVSHKKGQYKYNKNGTYYYETLDGRSPANKTILSSWDTLTVDGVGANRYDWMDSDGLDKSAAGTVAKMVTKIAPLALSIGFPTIGTIYAWSGIGLEMMQAMPMLYEMTAGLMSDSDTPAVLNNISGFARGLMTGTSDYAKKHMFSLENFASIISDVPNQWAQQQAIAKGVNKMLGTNLIQDAIIKKTYKSPKELMKLYDKMGSNNELAKYGSLAYMSMISNIDVYDSMLRSGATRHEAAMAALGGTVGMTYANQKLGFGEMFLDNDTKKFMNSIATAVGKSAKQVQQEVARQSVSNAERESVNHLMGVFNLAKTKSADAIKGLFKDIKNGTATVYQKAIGEGIEEVSEELIMDFSKATTETLANFGWRGPLDQLDTDAFDHMLERYTMSLIGGAIGGGIFGGIESFKVRGVKNNELNRELTYYVSKGYTGKILDELEKLRDKGLLASKDLSAKREIDKETGEVVYQSTTNKEESQNEAVYQILRSSVLAYDAAINQNGLDVSDNELINILSNNDVRLKSLLDNHYDGKMINDFHNLTNEILDLEEKIKQITTSRKVLTDKEERNLTTEERGLIEKFNTEKDELLKKYDEKKIEAENFKNGNKSLYYIKQFLFGVNDYVNNPFLNSNFESWVFGTTGKEVASLSKSELDNLHERYKQYVAGAKVDNIQSALDVFDRFNMEYSNSLQENEDTYKNVSNLRFDLFDEIYQHSDDGNALINDVGGFVVKDGFAFVNEDYITQLRDEIEELVKEGKADEIAEKQKEIDESVKQNQNVILNVNKLIDTITANYGYIDADSIKMIRNLFLSKTDIMKSLLAHNKMANGLKVSDIDKLINEKIMSGKKEDIDEIKGSIVENAVKEYNENKINAITEITDKYEKEAKEDVKSIAGDLVNAVAEKTGFENSSKDETLFKIETKKIPDGTEIKIGNRTITNIKISYEVIDATSGSQETIFSSAGDKLSLRSEEDDDGNNKIVSDNKELKKWIEETRNLGMEEDDFSFIINQKISFDVKFNDDSNVGYSSKITNTKTVENMSLYDSVVKTEEVTLNSEEKIEKASKELLNDVTTVVDDVVNDYTVKSSQLSAINSLDQRLASAKVNPIYDLIRKFAINNTGEKVNIIDFIEEQDKKLENVKGIEDYVLSDDAINDIKRARDILKIINSIIIASRNIEANQFAFNTILNKYIKDHSLEGQNENTYGVIDPILANQMCTEVTRLEIRLKALEMLSVNNQMNKFKQFMKTGEKIDKSKLDFYKQPMMLELTEGIDFSKYETAWDENHELYINEIESLIYDNFKKRVDSGTKNQVDEFNKLQAVNELRDEVKKKGYKTAMLDKEVELTDLNKLTLLGALVAVRSNDYNLAIKKSLNEFPDNFAPIPSQDFATRILSSYIINRDLMTSIIEDNPYSNIVIGEGVAGSGKTTAEGKLSLYIARELLGNDTKAWTASFSQDQVNNITSSIQGDNPESIHTKIDSSKRIYEANGLLDHILGGKVAELLSEVGKAESFFEEIIKGNPKVTKESIKEEYDKFSILNISESSIEIKDKIKEEIMSGDNDAPSVLYIDEYTWLMPPALNIIQLWAKRNGVTVICLGDSNQNGYDLRYADGNKTLSSDLTNGNNMIKTPKLGMSLRENNIQKSSNIRTSNIILDTINNVNFESESDVNELLKYVTGFPVSVYDNNGIVNGEKITSSLDDSFFDEQKKSDNAKIGYIYDSIDSDTYKQMTKKKDEGYNIVFFTEKEVQGNECPYFVVDIDWKKKLNLLTIGNVYNTNVIDGKLSISINGKFEKDRAGALKRNLSNFFTSWNTLITRSQVGSVLIDNSKDKILSSLFSIKSESNQAFVPSKEPEIKKMRENKISLFSNIKDEPYSYTRPTVKSANEANPTTKPTTEPPVAAALDDTSKSTDTDSDTGKKNTTLSAFEGTASFSSDLLTFILDENVENPVTSDISEDFSSSDETKKVSSRLASPDEDFDSGNINDVESISMAEAIGKTTFHMTRAYTDVVRAGCEITEKVSSDGKSKSYSAKNNETDGVISDLWLLMNADETITEKKYNGNIEKLKLLQFYLTYKHIYGKNVKLPKELDAYKELYENGKIVIKIDPNFKNINNYDKNPGNEWKNNENGKNALKDISEFEGKGAYVTLQCIYKSDKDGIVRAVTLGELTALKIWRDSSGDKGNGYNNYYTLLKNAMNGDGKTKYYEVNTSLMKPTNNPYIVFPKRNKEGIECKSLNDMLNDEKLICSMPYVYCGQQSVNELEHKTSRLFRKGKNDTYFIPGTKVNKRNGSLEATTIGHEVIFVTTNQTLEKEDLKNMYIKEKEKSFKHIIDVLKNKDDSEYKSLSNQYDIIYKKYMSETNDKEESEKRALNKLAMLYKPFGDDSNPDIGVRMIPLRRNGVNVSELFSMMQKITTKDGEEKNNMTIDGYFQSIRMFASLWNYYAQIKNLLNAFSGTEPINVSDNNYIDKTISFFKEQKELWEEAKISNDEIYKNGYIRLIPDGTKIGNNEVTNRRGAIIDGSINETSNKIFNDYIGKDKGNSVLGITIGEAERMKNMLENLFKTFNQFPGANSEIGKFITENTGEIKQGKSIKYISQKFMVYNSTPKQVENKTIRIGEQSNDEKFDNMKAFLLLVAKTYRLVHLMEIKSKEDDIKKESNLKWNEIVFTVSDATGDTDINLFDIINAGEEYNGTESNNNISTFTRTMNLALHGTANGVATKDSNGHMNYWSGAMFSHGIFVNSIIKQRSSDDAFADINNDINKNLLVDVKVESPLVNIDLSGDNVLGNMKVMEINDIFAEEKKEVKVEEPKVEEKPRVEESKIEEKSQEEVKREELINGGWTWDEKTGTLTNGLDEKEWDSSKNEYITSKTKSNSTDDDKEKAKEKIKEILKKYDIKFDDDNKNSIFDKILNDPKKRVKDMLSKDINMDEDSMNEIISNREIIKGKC